MVQELEDDRTLIGLDVVLGYLHTVVVAAVVDKETLDILTGLDCHGIKTSDEIVLYVVYGDDDAYLHSLWVVILIMRRANIRMPAVRMYSVMNVVTMKKSRETVSHTTSMSQSEPSCQT